MNNNALARRSGYRDRGTRIPLHCDGILTEADGCRLNVTIVDVSRDGFRLQSRSELEIGASVMLQVRKSPPVRALIRWTCGEEAGGVFLDPVSL